MHEPYYRWLLYTATFIDKSARSSILEEFNTQSVLPTVPLNLSKITQVSRPSPISLATAQDAIIVEEAGLFDLVTRPDTDKFSELWTILKKARLRGMLEILLTVATPEEVWQLLEPTDMRLQLRTVRLFRDLFWDMEITDSDTMKGVLKLHSHYNKRLLIDALEGVPIDALLWDLGFGFSEEDGDKKLSLLYDASLAAGLRSAHTNGRELPKLAAIAIQLNRELQTESTAEWLQKSMKGATIETAPVELKRLPEES